MSLFKKVPITIFILFNFLTMARTHLPLNSSYFKALYRPVDKYLSFFSIYQDWMMFSPNPGRVDSYLSATIQFDDGTKTSYQFPKPSRYAFIDNHTYGEKFRKLVSESIRKDDRSYMWEDTAKFALRQVIKKVDYMKMPKRVSLHRHWDETPDISTQFRPHSALVTDYQKFNFYSYEVFK